MVLAESVSCWSTAAEVLFVPAGSHTSSAFAVVNGSWVMTLVVPGIDGVVKLPLLDVVPLSARLAQHAKLTTALSGAAISPYQAKRGL